MKFLIQGGHKLSGRVAVQGSKNAAMPVLAASILASGSSEIENVPDIADVRNFLEILRYLGAEFEFKDHRVRIDTANLKNRDLPENLMAKMRGSILFAGSLLARFGRSVLAYPGGDLIGRRPIEAHLEGFEKLGATARAAGNRIEIIAGKLKGAEIVMGVTSVTGTENLILASVLAEGPTQIHLAATEPHVQNLCQFLGKMGAKIEGIGTPNLLITGGTRLHGAKHTLCPDEIDAVTFCAAAAATKGEVTVSGVDLDSLHAPLHVLEKMQVNFAARPGEIEIRPPREEYRAVNITTGVFPQLLTDEQPLFGVLATQSRGQTSIHDWIYEGRQGYLRVLQEMGAKVVFDDAHRCRIYGPTALRGAEIKTPDLRAGASILIAALIAKGQSVIYNAEIIDRGYERIDERLNALGTAIKRTE